MWKSKRSLIVALTTIQPFIVHYLSGQPMELGSHLAVTYVLGIVCFLVGSIIALDFGGKT
jgi:hypothetical protein